LRRNVAKVLAVALWSRWGLLLRALRQFCAQPVAILTQHMEQSFDLFEQRGFLRGAAAIAGKLSDPCALCFRMALALSDVPFGLFQMILKGRPIHLEQRRGPRQVRDAPKVG
jgi:hypothetical protein